MSNTDRTHFRIVRNDDVASGQPYPWLVEHAWSEDPHDHDGHEYGAFASHAEALAAANRWAAAECGVESGELF